MLAKEDVAVAVSDLFGVAGQRLLDRPPLGRAYTIRVESLRDVRQEITMLDREVAGVFDDYWGYQAVHEIGGVGPCGCRIFGCGFGTAVLSEM